MNISILFEKNCMIPIFDVFIEQKEGEFATATLVVEAGVPLPPPGTQGVIQGETCLFKGILTGKPPHIEGNFAEIQLVAMPQDWEAQRIRLQEESRIPPYWEELWVKNPDDETELQDVHTSSVYYDRRGRGDVMRSDWFEGRQVLDIQDGFFRDCLRVRSLSTPSASCTINVHVHWVQREEGVENLSSHIRAAFPEGRVSTYTMDGLSRHWPETGQSLGRSGIWVIRSELQEVDCSYSPSVSLRQDNASLKPYRLKRHWFKAILWVGWRYLQRRKETLSVTLHHGVQQMTPVKGDHKVIDVTLRNIYPDPDVYGWKPETFYREGGKVFYHEKVYLCRKSHVSGLVFEEEDEDIWLLHQPYKTHLGARARASFFLTERGYQVADHVLERARWVLARSARALEVSFEGPWDLLHEVTTDTTICLKDSRLPGGEVRGKVTAYQLIVRGDTGERLVKVAISCSIGIGSVPVVPLPAIPDYGEETYDQKAYQTTQRDVRLLPSGVGYLRYDAYQPPQRERGTLLKRARLVNGPVEQETELQNLEGTSVQQFRASFRKVATRLYLHFRDLRTREELAHRIPVEVMGDWSAPQQVMLSVQNPIGGRL